MSQLTLAQKFAVVLFVVFALCNATVNLAHGAPVTTMPFAPKAAVKLTLSSCSKDGLACKGVFSDEPKKTYDIKWMDVKADTVKTKLANGTFPIVRKTSWAEYGRYDVKLRDGSVDSIYYTN